MTEFKQPRVKIDWEAVENDWRIGKLTEHQMAEKHNVSREGMRKRFKKAGIGRDARIDFYTTERATEVRKNSKPGFVYVITFDAGSGEEFYKIGMSDDPVKRLAHHQCASPFDLRIVISYFAGNMSEEEASLHSIFDSARVRGEWFRLCSDDLAMIADRSVRA